MSFFKSITKTFKNISLLKITILLLVLLIVCSVMEINIMPNTIEGLNTDSQIMKNFIHRYVNLLEEDVKGMCTMEVPSTRNVSENTLQQNMVLYLNTTNPEWRDNVCFDNIKQNLYPDFTEEEWEAYIDVAFEDILTSGPRGCAYLNYLKFGLEEKGVQTNADLEDRDIREMGGDSSMGSWEYLMKNVFFSDSSVEDSFRYWLDVKNQEYKQKCTGYEFFHRDHNDDINEEITRIRDWWGENGHPSMDFDSDGIIDIRDLLIELMDSHAHVTGRP